MLELLLTPSAVKSFSRIDTVRKNKQDNYRSTPQPAAAPLNQGSSWYERLVVLRFGSFNIKRVSDKHFPTL